MPGGPDASASRGSTVDAVFPSFAQFLVIDPGINSTRAQNWNVTIEQQFGTTWQASVSYLGQLPRSHVGRRPPEPWRLPRTRPLHAQRRELRQLHDGRESQPAACALSREPGAGQGLGYVNRISDVGTQSYRALRFPMRRSAASGLSLSGNYTLSHCEADTEVSGGWLQFEEGYLNPEDPSFDRGNCGNNRRQIGNVSLGAQTPSFTNPMLRVLASDWRVSGIFSARSGAGLP